MRELNPWHQNTITLCLITFFSFIYMYKIVSVITMYLASVIARADFYVHPLYFNNLWRSSCIISCLINTANMTDKQANVCLKNIDVCHSPIHFACWTRFIDILQNVWIIDYRKMVVLHTRQVCSLIFPKRYYPVTYSYGLSII